MGYSSNTLFKEFTALTEDYSFNKIDRTLEEIKNNVMNSSLYEENSQSSSTAVLDIFITEKNLGFDFFNQSINIPTQIAGFVYKPTVYDGSLGNSISFITHDFAHYQRQKSHRLQDPAFKKISDSFVTLYTEKISNLNKSDADRLSRALFLADHEQDAVLDQLWWAYKNGLDFELGILSLGRQAEIKDGIPLNMPIKEGKLIIELMRKALEMQ